MHSAAAGIEESQVGPQGGGARFFFFSLDGGGAVMDLFHRKSDRERDSFFSHISSLGKGAQKVFFI